MVNKKMEGNGRSSLMLLFQRCSSFSSRCICKQDLMRRCHLDWNCQILPPCWQKRSWWSWDIQIAAYHSSICVSHPPPALPAQSFLGRMGASSLFPPHGWELGISLTAPDLCFSLAQHWCSTLPSACLVTWVLLLGWGCSSLSSPMPWGRLAAKKQAGHHCPGVWVSPRWAARAPAGSDNGQCY